MNLHKFKINIGSINILKKMKIKTYTYEKKYNV